MELYILGGLVALGGLLTKEKIIKKEIKNDIIPENEKSSHITNYASNHLEKVHKQQFDKSVALWNKGMKNDGVILPASKYMKNNDYIKDKDQPLVLRDEQIEYQENPLQEFTNDGTVMDVNNKLPTSKSLEEAGIQSYNDIQRTLTPLGQSFEGITEHFKNITENSMKVRTVTGEYRVKGIDWGRGHSNMIPNFGKKINQNMRPDINKTLLESYSGTRPIYSHKKELKKFFPLEKNNNVFGQKVASNRQEERYIPALTKNGIKPFEQIRVPRGLNQGANNKSKVVFHDMYRPHVKEVNELRVNPREEYKGVIVPGKHFVDQGTKRFEWNTRNSSNKRYLSNFEANEDIKVRPLIPNKYGSGGTKERFINKDNIVLRNTQRLHNEENQELNMGVKRASHDKSYTKYDIRVSNKPVYSVNPIEAIKLGEGTYMYDRETNKLQSTLKEQVIDNKHSHINYSGSKKITPHLPEERTRTTTKEQTHFSHDGNMSSSFKKPQDQAGARNVQFNGIRELTIDNRVPNQVYYKKGTEKETINMQQKKLSYSTYDLNRRITKNITKQNYNIGELTIQKNEYNDNELNNNRLNPDILKSFNDNPYSQKLNMSHQTYNRASDISKKEFSSLRQSQNIFKSF